MPTAFPSRATPPARDRRLARLAIDLRPGEGRVLAFLFGAHFLLLTFQYAAKALRQSTFIDAYGAERLPLVYLGVALLSLPVLALHGRLVDRWPQRKLIAVSSLAVGLSLLGFWALFRAGASWASAVFYLWIAIVGVLLVSQFWCYAGQLLDARQAKRLFAPIGAGGILGSIAGGQAAGWASRLADPLATLPVAAAVLLGLAALMLWGRRAPASRPETEHAGAEPETLADARHGFDVVRRSRYLRRVAALVLVSGVVAQVIDLQFGWAIERATGSLEERTAVFGNLYSLMGVLAFGVQLFFTARLHRRYGVGLGLRLLPLAGGAGSALLLFAAFAQPALLLPAAWLLKIGDNGLRYSVDQATRELLFVPVAAAHRPKAKAFIDVFVLRAAKGVAALALLGVAFGRLAVIDTVWLALGLIVVWLALAGAVRRGYVASLRERLRPVARRAPGGRVPAPAPRHAPGGRDPARAQYETEPRLDDELAGDELLLLLYDPDPRLARAAAAAVARRVAAGARDPLFVPVLVSRLADRRLERAARRALVAYGAPVMPALGHFLRDEREAVAVRRALPAAIAGIGGPAARATLVASLDTPDPILRRRVIEALARLRARGEDLGGHRGTIEAQLVAECRAHLDALIDLEGRARHAPEAARRRLAERIDAHRANLFRLLELVAAPRDVRAARAGLASGRATDRAHALELLDNVLRGEVRRSVFAVIDDLPLVDRLRLAGRPVPAEAF